MRFTLFVALLIAAGCTSRDSRTGNTTPTNPAVSSNEATPPPYEDPNQSTVPDPSTQQHPPLGPQEPLDQPLDQPPIDQTPQPQSPSPTEDPNDPNRDPSQPRKPTTPQPQPPAPTPTPTPTPTPQPDPYGPSTPPSNP